MAVTRSGVAKTNGHTNGQTNGSLTKGSKEVGGVNGHASTSVRRTSKTRSSPGFFVRIAHIVARLFTWYLIVTVLFRCPSSLDECTESSPLACKSYFRLKDTVSPHLTPYYNTYAAPYVEIAKPYYDTLDRVVISPSRTYAAKYGGPKLAQAQTYGQAQWEKQVQPQLVKFQAFAKEHYDQSVSPHVEKVSAVLSPYYGLAKNNALQTYHELVLPTYVFVQPYALQGYDAASTFTKDTAIPYTALAWNKTYVFLDSTVWPRLRDVYTATVEPQLVRIVGRLDRYNRKTKSAAEDVASSFTKPSSSATPSSQTSSEASTQAESTPSAASEVLESQEEPAADVKVGQKSNRTPDEVREQAAKTVAEDLELWQGKFSQAVEEGAIEIEERVDEISGRMLDHHSAMGSSLVSQLKETVRSELSALKPAILAILEKRGDDADRIEEEVVAAVRAAGLKIKDKAQDVRTWRQAYEQETEIAVTKAAQEHFDILHRTRDLALQKIGMKWAWMDGITYQHWKQYHALRAQFEKWTEELKSMVTSHPGLVAAQKAGTDVEDEAMAIAQESAEELARLKKVATWKAVAHDYSENFDSETVRLAAEAAEQKVVGAAQDASEAVEQTTESVAEQAKASVESVSERAEDTVSQVISSDDGARTQTAAEVEAESGTSALPPMESLASEPVESASELSSSAQDADSTAASDPVADGPEQVQETLVETPDGSVPTEDVDVQLDDEFIEKPDAETATIKPAFFGVAAQAVPSRQPILDDDTIESASSSLSSAASVVRSDIPGSITSAAQAAYTAALGKAADQYMSAKSAVSAQISGEPKPAHEELFSSASSVYFGAVASANSQLSEASAAASRSIYGTPTANWLPNSMPVPTVPSLDWEKVQSIAHQNWQDSVSWANQQYDAAKEAVGDQYESAKLAIGAAEPTPSTYLEAAEKRAQKLLDQAQHNYYAGLGLAHARYSDFLSSASSAVSSLTTEPTPTDIQGSASSAVSAASEAAESAASAATDAAGSVVGSVAGAASDAGDKVAESWDFVINQVSSQVYGAPTPTPWYENLYDAATDYASAAGEYAASATDAAADQYASAASAAEDYVSSAGGYASSAGDAASSHYVAVSSLISELVSGKEPTFTESVYSRLAGAYASGTSSASVLASAASETVASAASEVADAAGSVLDAAGETAASATDKVKDTPERARDEL